MMSLDEFNARCSQLLADHPITMPTLPEGYTFALSPKYQLGFTGLLCAQWSASVAGWILAAIAPDTPRPHLDVAREYEIRHRTLDNGTELQYEVSRNLASEYQRWMARVHHFACPVSMYPFGMTMAKRLPEPFEYTAGGAFEVEGYRIEIEWLEDEVMSWDDDRLLGWLDRSRGVLRDYVEVKMMEIAGREGRREGRSDARQATSPDPI